MKTTLLRQQELSHEFRLNPNIPKGRVSGFKACVPASFAPTEPMPEFALTVPGDMASVEPLTEWQDRH
ncbi:MAG: hypothetical protein ACOVOD_17230 [Rhodoferax sp.]